MSRLALALWASLAVGGWFGVMVLIFVAWLAFAA
jgi:hypothetical protein